MIEYVCVCVMHGRDDKCKKNVQSESQGKRPHGMSSHNYGNTKMILKKGMGVCEWIHVA